MNWLNGPRNGRGEKAEGLLEGLNNNNAEGLMMNY